MGGDKCQVRCLESKKKNYKTSVEAASINEGEAGRQKEKIHKKLRGLNEEGQGDWMMSRQMRNKKRRKHEVFIVL